MRTEQKGFLLALSGALVFTPDVLLIRLAAADPFTLASVRSVAAGIVLVVGLGLAHRQKTIGEFFKLGRWGLIAGLLQATSGLMFCFALSHTTAANALLMFATTPLLAAALGWAVLRERVPLATWLAIVGAFIGISIVAGGSLQGGGFIGDMMALGNALSTAIFFLVVRHRSHLDFMPANILGFIFGALLASPFGHFTELQPLQWAWLVAGGAFVLPAAISLYTVAVRYLPAAEVALIGLLEVVLGPLLLWFVLREMVPASTIIGGMVVLAALVFHMGMSLLRPST